MNRPSLIPAISYTYLSYKVLFFMCPSTHSQLAVRFQLKWYIWYITPTATGTGVRRRPHGTQLTLPRFSSFLLDHDVCDMRTKLPVRIMLCQMAIMKQSKI